MPNPCTAPPAPRPPRTAASPATPACTARAASSATSIPTPQEGGGSKGLGKKCNTIAPNATQSCRVIGKDANHKGGGQLSKFYNDNRIIAYKSGNEIIGDAFFSKIP